MYFLVLNNQQAGPFSMDQLKQLVKDGTLTKQTFVWKEGMANWASAQDVTEVKALFIPVPPPIPVMPPAMPCVNSNASHDDDKNVIKASNEDELNEVVRQEQMDLLCGHKLKEPYVVLINKNEVEEDAFSYCDKIRKVILGPNVKCIGEGAFQHCEELAEVVIGENVERIEDMAFSNCDSLKKIFIPKNVRDIDGTPFYGTPLEIIQVDEDNAHYDSRDNCNAIIETDSGTLICGCMSTVVPEGVTSIGDDAFNCCQGLSSIDLPAGVKHIGDKAFCQCHDLESITLSDGLKSIGYAAFCGCGLMTSISIPNSVESIGEDVFEDCDNLEDIYILDESLLEDANVPEDANIITIDNLLDL